MKYPNFLTIFGYFLYVLSACASILCLALAIHTGAGPAIGFITGAWVTINIMLVIRWFLTHFKQ